MTKLVTSEEKEKDSYVVNPPLVHCLDITADGLIAAAGLENSKVSSLLLTSTLYPSTTSLYSSSTSLYHSATSLHPSVTNLYPSSTSLYLLFRKILLHHFCTYATSKSLYSAADRPISIISLPSYTGRLFTLLHWSVIYPPTLVGYLPSYTGWLFTLLHWLGIYPPPLVGYLPSSTGWVFSH